MTEADPTPSVFSLGAENAIGAPQGRERLGAGAPRAYRPKEEAIACSVSP